MGGLQHVPHEGKEQILNSENRDAILTGLTKKAKEGDTHAAKMILEYTDRFVDSDLAPQGFREMTEDELLEMAGWVQAQ